MSDLFINANLLARFFTNNWFDLVCIALLGLTAAVGFKRGFSRMLGMLTAILIALQGGYWLHPSLAHHLRGLKLVVNHPVLGSTLSYIMAMLVGLLFFFIFHKLLGRFFRLIVEQPVDRIFGTVTGVAVGLLSLFLAVSLAILLPENNTLRHAVCTRSQAGRIITPCLYAVLNVRPTTVIKLAPAERSPYRRRPTFSIFSPATASLGRKSS